MKSSSGRRAVPRPAAAVAAPIAQFQTRRPPTPRWPLPLPSRHCGSRPCQLRPLLMGHHGRPLRRRAATATSSAKAAPTATRHGSGRCTFSAAGSAETAARRNGRRDCRRHTATAAERDIREYRARYQGTATNGIDGCCAMATAAAGRSIGSCPATAPPTASRGSGGIADGRVTRRTPRGLSRTAVCHSHRHERRHERRRSCRIARQPIPGLPPAHSTIGYVENSPQLVPGGIHREKEMVTVKHTVSDAIRRDCSRCESPPNQ
jgi:hypothetical protein